MFVRIILHKNKLESAFPLYKQLQILPVRYLFVFKTLKLFYILSGNRGTNKEHYSTRSVNQRIFLKPKVNRTLFKQSYLYLGPNLFNQLAMYIKECNN